MLSFCIVPASAAAAVSLASENYRPTVCSLSRYRKYLVLPVWPGYGTIGPFRGRCHCLLVTNMNEKHSVELNAQSSLGISNKIIDFLSTKR